MLLIVVGYGFLGDPFTCSVSCPDEMDAEDADALMAFVCEKQKIEPEVVDEILVVADDEVLQQHSFEPAEGEDEEEQTQVEVEPEGEEESEEEEVEGDEEEEEKDEEV